MKYIVVISCSLLLLACAFPSSHLEFPEGSFSIYLLRDSTLTAHDAFSRPIGSLALADSALLNVHDLNSYVWSTHAFTLTQNARALYEHFLLAHGTTRGVPFVVTVGNDRIYVGTFWWGYSSSMPPACAVINAIAPLPYRIQLANGAIDKRGDSRVYLSLKLSGVLSE